MNSCRWLFSNPPKSQQCLVRFYKSRIDEWRFLIPSCIQAGDFGEPQPLACACTGETPVSPYERELVLEHRSSEKPFNTRYNPFDFKFLKSFRAMGATRPRVERRLESLRYLEKGEKRD